MAYEPQPGTIPHRAVAWLRAMNDLYMGKWFSTPDLCLGLDVEVAGFTAYMAPCRTHGTVQTMQKPETGKVLWWRIGDGSPFSLCEPDLPIKREQPVWRQPQPGPILPGIVATKESEAQRNAFRALPWEGKLLVTGMEIRDGVAIFEPEQVLELKRHTDWWRAEA